MPGKAFSFGFSIGASLAPSVGASFMKVNKGLYAMKGAMWDLQQAQSDLNKAFSKGIINQKSFDNAQKMTKMYQDKLNRVNSGEILHKSMLDMTALFYTAQNVAGFLAEPVQSAIQFESVMADVRKVVDFDTPEQFQQMNRDILELSKNIPMTAEGLGKIVAAGGQSGIAREDLTAFAEAAAKMGVAFDISADQAGDMMAKWRTAFKINQADVEALADKINYLGNTTAASAPLISDVVTRIGPLGEVGGVASGEIAALGASMVGSGIESDVAATGIKNLILAMVSGESATKTQKEAFAQLGISTTELAQRMQTDARGAILDVFQSISQLDKASQASVLQNIFGKESLGAIAPLLSNLDGLRDNFNKVGDAANYAGSMQAEFDTRSKTTANSAQLMKNRMEAAKIAIGTGILPVMTPFVELLGSLASGAGDLAARFPGLIQALALFTAGVFSLVVAYRAWQVASAAMTAAHLIMQTVLKNNTVATIINTNAALFSSGVMKLWAGAQWLVNAAMAACPFFLMLAGIALLTGAAVWLINNWDTVKQWFITLWNDPAQALQEFVDGIRSRFGSVIDWLSQKWEALKGLFSSPISGQINVTANESAAVAQNAEGGIYRKGAFLTTFAENSPEAAIPLNGSSRAVSLWTQAGQSLGVLPRASNGMTSGHGGNVSVEFRPVINISGNADESTVQRVMALSMDELRRMLLNLQRDERRLSYE